MTMSWTTLLWIAAILLVLLLAWWVWRNWRTAAASARETTAPPEPPVTTPKPQLRRPTVPPPPALAGPNPHAGRLPPDASAPAGAGPDQVTPPRPRSPSARPPAAAAGPRAAAPDAAQSPTPTPAPRPGVVPPPAASGGAARTPAPARPAAPDIASPTAPVTQPSRTGTGTGTGKSANALAAVSSWGYQLQKLDLARAAASPFELLVVDYSRDGSDEKALRAKDLDKLKRQPNGSRRLVLAYLSIGEAESYRYYWDPAWTADKPGWLLSENPDWAENYAVCFWDPGWQRLMCGTAASYLDKIIAAGFDGVYLDKCDVFEDLEQREKKAAKTRPDLEGDMVRFVVDLSRYAKSKAPGFSVVMQNAENLLEHEALRASIDAVAKEELLYGLSGSQRKNAKGEIAEARKLLDLARQAGKPVLVVEYLDDAAKIADAARYTADAGYVLYIAPKDRELDRLNYESFEA